MVSILFYPKINIFFSVELWIWGVIFLPLVIYLKKSYMYFKTTSFNGATPECSCTFHCLNKRYKNITQCILSSLQQINNKKIFGISLEKHFQNFLLFLHVHIHPFMVLMLFFKFDISDNFRSSIPLKTYKNRVMRKPFMMFSFCKVWFVNNFVWLCCVFIHMYMSWYF